MRYLCRFDDFCEVVHDGADIIFEPLVVVLQQSLFALRKHSLSSHRARENTRPPLPVHIKITHLAAFRRRGLPQNNNYIIHEHAAS